MSPSPGLQQKLGAAVECLYRRVLSLYPPRFREIYGPAMLQALRDALGDQSVSRRDLVPLILKDLATSLARQHLAMLGNRITRPALVFNALVLSGIASVIAVALYAIPQHVLRSGLNDPQIQIATDLAARLEQGSDPAAVLAGGQPVNMTVSLAPFLIIYDDQGHPIASQGMLNGTVPVPPAGVFDHVRQRGEDRLTWQPVRGTGGVRIAAIIERVNGPHPGFILAGRNMREVEARIGVVKTMAGLTWLGMIALIAIGTIAFGVKMNVTQKLAIGLCISFGLGTLSATGQPSGESALKRTLVRAGHVLDVKTGRLADNQTIVVVGDKIESIGPSASVTARPEDEVVDLGSTTVMPGLIDVHTHLTMNPDFDPYRELISTSAKEAINGVVNARTTLMAGFTTVRNVGASGFVDVDLRDAINAGQVPGPHMQVSGPLLGITGGHCDENLLPIQYHLVGDGVADGIEQVQHKVRENIKYGADLIKICATGGVLSKGDDPQASQYTLEEMQAIVSDAHRLGRRVAAHAHGAQGILWATEAGVDSIEHGSYIDDAGIAEMKKRGTYLVPTLYLEDWMVQSGHLPPFYHQKMVDVSAVAKRNIKRAMQAGVKIALGTDAAVYPHGLNAHELDVYVNQLGMSPLAALQTATVNAADLMGWTEKTGTLEPGKWADIIGVEKNPLDDVRLLEDVKFVMKGGVVYKMDGKAKL